MSTPEAIFLFAVVTIKRSKRNQTCCH